MGSEEGGEGGEGRDLGGWEEVLLEWTGAVGGLEGVSKNTQNG